MGETLVMNIKEVGEKNGTMDISRISDKQKAVEEAEKGKFCAVMVIPEDFSMKQMALKSGAREAAEIRIYINQGSYGLLGNSDGGVDGRYDRADKQSFFTRKHSSGKLRYRVYKSDG